MNAVDSELSTPLHLAVRPNNVVEMDMVTLLIKAGADLEAADQAGRRPIDALPQPQVTYIALFLHLARNIDTAFHVPWQLLVHFAVAEGRVSLMRQLCTSRGCKIEDPNPEGLTPLHVAAMRGDSAMVRVYQL